MTQTSFDLEFNDYPYEPISFMQNLNPECKEDLLTLANSIINASKDPESEKRKRRSVRFKSQNDQTIEEMKSILINQLGPKSIKSILHSTAYSFAVYAFKWVIRNNEGVNEDTVTKFLSNGKYNSFYRYYVAARNLFDALPENEKVDYNDVIERLIHPDKISQILLDAEDTKDESVAEFKHDIAELLQLLSKQTEIVYSQIPTHEA